MRSPGVPATSVVASKVRDRAISEEPNRCCKQRYDEDFENGWKYGRYQRYEEGQTRDSRA